MIECPICKGEGKYSTPKIRDHGSFFEWRNNEWEVIQCPLCRGKGQLDRFQYAEYLGQKIKSLRARLNNYKGENRSGE